jgi:hypothetical protein
MAERRLAQQEQRLVRFRVRWCVVKHGVVQGE